MEAATWWIKTHRLDHFEKATKIRVLVAASADYPNHSQRITADQTRDKPC